MKKYFYLSLLAVSIFAVGCTDEDDMNETTSSSEISAEFYAGGSLGTSTTWGSKCFEQSGSAVDSYGYADDFLRGEQIFEGYFATEKESLADPRGRGPLSIRESCIHCHPGYGHGKRLGDYGNDIVGFKTATRTNGNGYLLVVYGPGAWGTFGADEAILSGITGSTWVDPHAEDDYYVSELTGMPQTQSIAPFKAPIDEDQITIQWLKHTDEWDNKYADGTSYELIYPEVNIPESAFAYKNDNLAEGAFKVKLEATIGIYGTGLLDAITEEDIDAEYESQLTQVWGGRRGKEITQLDGSVRKGRFTYALTRGTLQNGPGSNALWNITNVTRESSTATYGTNYMTTFYAESAASDAELIEDIKSDSYYGTFLVGDNDNDAETSIRIYNYLMYNNWYGVEKLTSTNYNDSAYDNTRAERELAQTDYVNFMVWHRGLAVPAARNTSTTKFKQGKELFEQMSCTACHRPSWTTGADFYVGDDDLQAKLPRYPYQTIWPYSDMLQHNLGMVNNIRTGWCRTTPLWGRSLNLVANGESSHLHDMRARTYEEAIMWHKGQGKYSSDQFRQLSKTERDAVVYFLESI
ncbi:MAG: di-heme oxidoredictase family protein [Rikenellaceae bacterium]